MSIAIAIDGPAGAGKSSLSKEVAKELSFIYVDTGALYRTIGLATSRKGIPMDDKEGIVSLLDEIQVKLAFNDEGAQIVLLNGEDVSGFIRTPQASMYASAVSAIPEVRAFLLDLQRDMAKNDNVIMDGRDIGTTVFPNAELKIFMTADPMVRASRRAAEMQAKGEKADIDEVLANLKERDYIDSHREVSPLTQAPDAVVLDNSSMTMDDQMEWVLDLIEKRFAKK